MWQQKTIRISPKSRGMHLITAEALSQLPELEGFRDGLAHFFICHTSASLGINENADPTVRRDLETYLNVIVPEDAPYYQHTLEGSDDMPAHIKSALLGSSVTIPITNGGLNLGAWQGLYLGEHRNHGRERRVVVTLQGE